MKTFKIPVTWESTGIIEVEAETLEEAIEKFDKYEDEVGYTLPDMEYVDDSFRREQDLEWIKDVYNTDFDYGQR